MSEYVGVASSGTSAAFFDLGVFAVVVGATLLILTALAHQSIRAHQAAPIQPSKAQD